MGYKWLSEKSATTFFVLGLCPTNQINFNMGQDWKRTTTKTKITVNERIKEAFHFDSVRHAL